MNDVPEPNATGGTATGGTARSTGHTSVGQVIALTAVSGDNVSQRFELDLQPIASPSSFCAGSTTQSGSCCYYAPAQRPPTLPPGTRTGSGTPRASLSAGTVTLTDASTNSRIQDFDYANGSYTHAPANFDHLIWQAGDTLRVDALGADIKPFTVSAPALVPPNVQFPSAIARAGDIVFTWQPDPLAEALVVSFLDGTTGESVVCSANDPAGSLTFDASVFAPFAKNARLAGLAQRSASRYAQTDMGRVLFKSAAWWSFDTSLN
jgi:hypothetical protein